MLLRCLRTESILPAIRWYIQQTLNESYLRTPIVNLSNIYEQTSSYQAVVFISGIGMDPTDKIFQLSQDLEKRIHVLSIANGLENVKLVPILLFIVNSFNLFKIHVCRKL